MRALLDLVLPTRCVGCGAAGVAACSGCLAALAGPARLVWPTPSPAGLPPPYAVAAYAGAARSMLLGYKEDGIAGLARPLGDALARSVAAGLEAAAVATAAAPSLGQRSVVVGRDRGPILLVPVPSTAASRRQRGDDVVLRLARRAAACLRAAGTTASVVPALRHARSVADSAGLGADARARNLAGAFTVRAAAFSSVRGRTVVVVDDLITTGVTAVECAAALRRSGALVVAVATVAATERRGHAFPWGSAQPEPWALPCPRGGATLDGGNRVDVVVKGRHTAVGDRFRAQAEAKLAKLERLDAKVARVDVEVCAEHNPRQSDQRSRVELTCRTRGTLVRAEAAAADPFAALDLAVGKLEERLRRAADRRRVHHGSRTPVSLATATAAAVGPSSNGAGAVVEAPGDSEEEGAGGGPFLVREKVHPARPMTLDQALFEMELVGHDFYLFVDSDHDVPSVVYRRRAYDYGVIRLVTTDDVGG